MQTFYPADKMDAWLSANLSDWVRPGNPLNLYHEAGKTVADSSTWPAEANGGSPPTRQEVIDWTAPVSDVEKLQQGIRTYREANEAAKEIIFTLMVKVAGALMAFELFTEDNVNAEGARFVAFHREPILDYKTAGRNAVSAQALYASVASDASKAAFPWLEGGTGPTFLGLFASELGVTP